MSVNSSTSPFFTSTNPLGDSQLILAGRRGDLRSLRQIADHLLSAGHSKSDVSNIFAHHTNRLGKTVLHEAAQNSREDCVRFLVEKSSVENSDGGIIRNLAMDPDYLKQGDWTPLMLACTKDNSRVIRTLVDAGASLRLKNKDGWTPFHIACREGHKDIIDYFLSLTSSEPWTTRSKNGRTPLHTAALYGRKEIIDSLISPSICTNVDEVDSCGTTPFMDALRAGHVELAEKLLLAGADLNKIDAVGRKAIHLSAQAGRDESIEFLIAQNERMESSSDGSNGSKTEYLVNAQTKDASKSRPAHFAAKEGHVSTLRLLKRYGADLIAGDSKGRSPLHMAASSQRVECIEYLLSEGAQDVEDYDGYKPSQLARKPDVKGRFLDFLT
jgi:ankyrin repeat protein